MPAVVGEEGGARRHLRLHRRGHLGVGVADEHRPEPSRKSTYSLPASSQMRPPCPLHNDLGRYVAEAAARQYALGLLDEPVA